MKTQKTSQSFYEIRVDGELGEMWVKWFEGLEIRKEFEGERPISEWGNL